MRLQPNVGSDRSWVWKVAADVSEGTPTAETLAIRFANSESTCLLSRQSASVARRWPLLHFVASLETYLHSGLMADVDGFSLLDADLFKKAFEEAQKQNADIAASSGGATEPAAEKAEEKAEVEEEEKEKVEETPAPVEAATEEVPKAEAEETPAGKKEEEVTADAEKKDEAAIAE